MLKNNLKYALALFFLLAFNCASKKTITEYRDRIINDTIVNTKTEIIVERFVDTLKIDNPCDSIGNLKPFKQVIATKQGKISIEGKDNNITAEIDLKEYKKIWEAEYKSKTDKNTIVKEKEIIRYKIPLWIIILCPILFLLGYIFGKIL